MGPSLASCHFLVWSRSTTLPLPGSVAADGLPSYKCTCMGLVHAHIRLSNPRRDDLAPVESDALVDTGAITMCIPEHMAIQLQLETLEEREVTTADGRKQLCPYVGPVRVTFQHRNCFTGALGLGDAVLLGAIPMEDVDLIIHPTSRQLSVDPESPNIPSVLVK